MGGRGASAQVNAKGEWAFLSKAKSEKPVKATFFAQVNNTPDERSINKRVIVRQPANGYVFKKDGLLLGVHNRGGTWVVTELNTGLLTPAYGATRKAAIDSLQGDTLRKLKNAISKMDLKGAHEDFKKLPVKDVWKRKKR